MGKDSLSENYLHFTEVTKWENGKKAIAKALGG